MVLTAPQKTKTQTPHIDPPHPPCPPPPRTGAAATAHTSVRSLCTNAKPDDTKYFSLAPSACTSTTPGRSCATVGACRGRMPITPLEAGTSTMSCSHTRSQRSWPQPHQQQREQSRQNPNKAEQGGERSITPSQSSVQPHREIVPQSKGPPQHVTANAHHPAGAAQRPMPPPRPSAAITATCSPSSASPSAATRGRLPGAWQPAVAPHLSSHPPSAPLRMARPHIMQQTPEHNRGSRPKAHDQEGNAPQSNAPQPRPFGWPPPAAKS